jgi:hypothetical protein
VLDPQAATPTSAVAATAVRTVVRRRVLALGMGSPIGLRTGRDQFARRGLNLWDTEPICDLATSLAVSLRRG